MVETLLYKTEVWLQSISASLWNEKRIKKLSPTPSFRFREHNPRLSNGSRNWKNPIRVLWPSKSLHIHRRELDISLHWCYIFFDISETEEHVPLECLAYEAITRNSHKVVLVSRIPKEEQTIIENSMHFHSSQLNQRTKLIEYVSNEIQKQTCLFYFQVSFFIFVFYFFFSFYHFKILPHTTKESAL